MRTVTVYQLSWTMSSPDEWTWTILTTGTTQKKQRCRLKGGQFFNFFIGPVGQTFQEVMRRILLSLTFDDNLTT